MREKRQHPRATLTTNVEIYRVQRNDTGPNSHFPQERVDTQARDISNGGMFLAGEAPWPMGTELLLMFELPGVGRTQIPGYLRWHSAEGFGIQFGLLGARETHAIGRLIRAEGIR